MCFSCTQHRLRCALTSSGQPLACSAAPRHRLGAPARRSRHLPCRALLAGRAGTGAALASALRGWEKLRFEVTEEPTARSEGARYSYTPSLGIFHALTGLHGDILIPEDRIKAFRVKAALGEITMDEALDGLLGAAWDAELEPFRHAGDGAPVRWLHKVI